jgi:hypothetical protein
MQEWHQQVSFNYVGTKPPIVHKVVQNYHVVYSNLIVDDDLDIHVLSLIVR